MKISDIISEAPVSDISFFGPEDEPNTFEKNDLRLVKNKHYHSKVKDFFKNSPFDYNLYFVNGDKPNSIKINGTDQVISADEYRIGEISPKMVKSILGFIPENQSTSITAIFTHNIGGTVNMTPWIVAHRLAHAIFYDHWKSYSTDAFNMIIQSSTEAMRHISKEYLTGTHPGAKLFPFKSARTGDIDWWEETIFECMAAFILRNKFSFVEDELKKYPSEMQEFLRQSASKIEEGCRLALEKSVGRAFLI